MTNCNIVLTFLIIHPRRRWAGVRLIIDKLEFFINMISFFILPLGISFFYIFSEYPWTILVIEIVLFEGKHFCIILFTLIPSFQIFLAVKQILNILIEYINIGSFFFDDLIYFICIEIRLRIRIFFVQSPLYFEN